MDFPVQKQTTTQLKLKTDEKILVVPRKSLFETSAPQGIIPVQEHDIQNRIEKYHRFEWRSKVENDLMFKQIIPYLIFRYQDQLFLMQRKAKATEQRLKSKYTLGIGGHIRESDLAGGSILDWSRREFTEEINFSGSLKPHFIGLLNDEYDDVGKVHTGFVYLLEGDSNNISVQSELQSGHLVTLEKCSAMYDIMERWSQIVFRHLETNWQKQS